MCWFEKPPAGGVSSLQSMLFPFHPNTHTHTQWLVASPFPFEALFPLAPPPLFHLAQWRLAISATLTQSQPGLPSQAGRNPHCHPITSNHMDLLLRPFLSDCLQFLIFLTFLFLLAPSFPFRHFCSWFAPPFLFPAHPTHPASPSLPAFSSSVCFPLPLCFFYLQQESCRSTR